MELLSRAIELSRRSREQDELIRELQFKNGLDLLSEHRESLSEERAKELLAGVNPNAVAVRLGSKSFGKESSAVAKETLLTLKHVVVADLADIIAGRPEAEALQVLKDICGALPSKSIRDIDLSENALGEKGIRALEDVLRSFESLESISFMNNGLSELSVQLLVSCLPTSQLKRLHFHNNMSGPGGAKAAAEIILSSPQIQDFRMSSSRVDASGGLPLLKAIRSKASNLVRINLSDSMFDEECTEEIVSAMDGMKNLTDLILRDTGVDKELLLPKLSNPEIVPKLAVLDLSGLELDCDDATTVGKMVGDRPRIQKLWMDDNELESEGVVNFCSQVNTQNSSKIELVSVETNQIGQRGAIALARFAIANTSVLKICLNDNQISTDGVGKIQELLASAGRTEILASLDDNAASDDEDEDVELDALTDALGANLKI